MKKIKQFTQITLITIFLISCGTSINKESPEDNLEKILIRILIQKRKEWK